MKSSPKRHEPILSSHVAEGFLPTFYWMTHNFHVYEIFFFHSKINSVFLLSVPPWDPLYWAKNQSQIASPINAYKLQRSPGLILSFPSITCVFPGSQSPGGGGEQEEQPGVIAAVWSQIPAVNPCNLCLTAPPSFLRGPQRPPFLSPVSKASPSFTLLHSPHPYSCHVLQIVS